jgi:hypothetical protein
VEIPVKVKVVNDSDREVDVVYVVKVVLVRLVVDVVVMEVRVPVRRMTSK